MKYKVTLFTDQEQKIVENVVRYGIDGYTYWMVTEDNVKRYFSQFVVTSMKVEEIKDAIETD